MAGKRKATKRKAAKKRGAPSAKRSRARPIAALDAETMERLRKLERAIATSVLAHDGGQRPLAIVRALRVALDRNDAAALEALAKGARSVLAQHSVTLPNVAKYTMLEALTRRVESTREAMLSTLDPDKLASDPDYHMEIADGVLKTVLAYPSIELRTLETALGRGDRLDALRDDPRVMRSVLDAMAEVSKRDHGHKRKPDAETLVRGLLAVLYDVPVGALKNLYAAHAMRSTRGKSTNS